MLAWTEATPGMFFRLVSINQANGILDLFNFLTSAKDYEWQMWMKASNGAETLAHSIAVRLGPDEEKRFIVNGATIVNRENMARNIFQDDDK